MSYSFLNEQNELTIHRESIFSLSQNHSFIEMIFFLFTKKIPSKNESELLSFIFSIMIDHGPNTPSAKKIITLKNEDLISALSKSLLTMDKTHGAGALLEARIMLDNIVLEKISAKDLVSSYLDKEKKLPGFGHRVYKETDPRSLAIIKKAKELNLDFSDLDIMQDIEKELKKQKGVKLVLNADGVIAAISKTMNIPTQFSPVLFLLTRIIGLSGHYIDED